MNYLLIVWVFISSVIISGIARSVAFRTNMVDVPNERSSHMRVTPRGGGIGFVVTFLLALIVLNLNDTIHKDLFLPFFGGGLLVAGIGYLDDLSEISPLQRFFVHFSAALWAVVTLGGVPPLSLGFTTVEWGVLGNIIGCIGIVWMINLYNFMDGIDGIAASEAIFVAGVTGAFLYINEVYDLAWVCWVLAAGCAGFLILNWAPARIFMGDVGSGFLGFVIGVSAIANSEIEELSTWIWLILLGVFVVDTLVTLARRLARSASWYKAHRTHAYQHATIQYDSHARVTLAIIGINLFWLLPWAVIVWKWTELSVIATILALSPLVFLAWHFDAGKERKV